MPRDASLSIKTLVTVPIMLINLANLFCPSSVLVKAAVTAPIAIISKPIPLAAIAPFKVLNPSITDFTPLTIPLKPVIAPPVILSSESVRVLVDSLTSPTSLSSFLVSFVKSSTPFFASSSSSVNFTFTSFIIF